MNRRVVITGLGLVTPLGTGVEKAWLALVEGRSGVRPITRFDATGFDTRVAGEVPDFQPELWMEKKEARRLDLFEQFALAAGVMAWEDSGLKVSAENEDRIGCLVGSGVGGIGSVEEAHGKLLDKGPGRVSAFLITQIIANLGAGALGIRLGVKGPNWVPVSACATGAHSIGEAARLIRYGECDAVLAGGAEAPLTPTCVAGFNAMKAMCSDRNDSPARASRPFDASRNGFVPAEGAGVLVVEELEHARRRGAKIVAELVGYGANSDAHHITAPAPGGEGAVRCMRRALQDAEMRPEEIGYINAHGTSTPLNDANETLAIKRVFGEHARRLAVSSTKSMTGHPLGAAGGIETVFSALALQRGVLPPTINYETPDPECDLDYVPNRARELRVEAAMSNSFGFGGTNAVLVLKRYRG
ncbi:MAG TPA: beta-ketoacyl-[acyl-carrier-protein] synthase II [Myxococcales bacterium]|nr:beta-ketoacyl-[acyl-carrier-protein] synthase II [Myxococcales bacterium]